MNIEEGIYAAKYIGKPIRNCKHGDTYQIAIEKNHYVYNVEIMKDNEMDMIQYTSEISIRNNWEIINNNSN